MKLEVTDEERALRRREQGRRWYANNAEKKKNYVKARYAADPQRFIRASQSYRERNPGCWREAHFKRLYNISTAEVAELLQRQENRCAICAAEFSLTLKPHVDHDHQTGLVRGMLCQRCNLMLGRVEKPGILDAIVRYLRTDQR